MVYFEKFKRNSFAIFILVTLSLAVPTASPSQAFGAETYKVDPVHSSIVFRVDHLGIAPFYGRFNNAEGTFVIDKNNAENNFAEIAVMVDEIDTQNQERDKHLKSEDFFDADKYPKISFKTKSFKKLTENKYEVEGRLSLHGVARDIAIEVLRTGEGKDPWGGYRMGFETTFSVLRSDFGMDKMIGLVGDEVLLKIAMEGIRQ